MPLQRRLPKRGFKNAFKVMYAPINVGDLAKVFSGLASVSLDDIYARGLCARGALVKVLGDGEIGFALTVEAHRFSASAADKIRQAGGEAKALEG